MSDASSNRTDVSTIHLDNISLQNREIVDESNSKYLGFDLSTQQLKAIAIDDRLRVCHSVSVDFDTELAEYKTRGGVHRTDDGSNSVTAPVNMWLKALDLSLDKLKLDGLDFSSVLAISGCAQQHGSVWWRRESSSLLANLNADEFLHKELVAAFALRDTPTWMDSSTSLECRQLEAQLGGAERLAELTGSRAYERFTGPQIARLMKHRRELYLVSERITLVSNFLASLFCGAYAPLDASDASGMNMMELRTKRWSDECLRAILASARPGAAAAAAAAAAPAGSASAAQGAEGGGGGGGNGSNGSSADELAPTQAADEPEQDGGVALAGLRARLGCSQSLVDDNIVDSHEVIGRVSRYFVDRYAFPAECLVSSFTGDNPASLAGLCLGRDELVLSLGTSDTAFFWLDQPRPNLNGHVLRNPLDERAFMGLICFKNGSKTRERIRDLHAHGDWLEFERLLNSVPRGNFGNLAFLYDLREIYPLATGDFRYNKLDQRVDAFAAPELEVRACLEGQFMRLLHHSCALGLDLANIRRLLVTGGASANSAILQVAADVFRRPVFVLESVANSACLGAAYLAKYAYELEQQKLDQSFSQERGQQRPQELATGPGAATSAASTGSTGGSGHSERPIDFGEMILGNPGADSDPDPDSDEAARGIRLVRAAEPTPIGASNGDVYEALLKRYVKLESEIALNNNNNNNNASSSSSAQLGAT